MSAARGFTLVEAVVSIGILTTALIVLSQLVATSVHANAGARYRTLATIIAQQKIEHLRSEATLADGDAVQHFDESGRMVCEGDGPCEAAIFSARWSVSSFPPVPADVLIDLTVTHAHRNYGAVHVLAVRPRTVR
jgi:uncharacterized protein (TIGR02598 family)